MRPASNLPPSRAQLARFAGRAKQLLSDEYRARMRGSLGEFMKASWKYIEPRKPLIWGWHIDCILAHLEAAFRGEIHELIINIPPRHVKPVADTSLVLLASGARVPLKAVVPDDQVITHLGRPGRVLRVAEQGELECVELVTHHGRVIQAAPDHPFLTPAGWVDAGDLRVGDVLAVVRSDPGQDDSRPSEEFRLAGYILGDGNVTRNRGGGMACNVHCEDGEERADIIRCAEKLGFAARIACGKTAAAGKRVNLAGGVRRWVEQSGMAGKTSRTKRVPGWVFTAPNAKVAHFIGAYFACDGTLNARGGARKDCCVSFCSVNRPLLEDVQHLLARMGVPARIRDRLGKPGHGFHKGPEPLRYYLLEITSADGVARFIEQVPVFHAKRARMAAWRPQRKQFDGPWMPDEIVAIRPAGKLPCRCLEVEGDHSFTAEDVAVHNSTLTCVIAPAWLWTWRPEARLLSTSYGLNLALRDANRSRRLLLSPWYQEHFADVAMDRSQSAKGRYDNNMGGYRVSGSVTGIGTGEGGDVVICDDPLKAADAESQIARETVIQWWSETMPTRLDNPETGTRILIMQRLHERDLTGFVLAEKNPETVHVCLPARFDPTRACATRWFRDPRTEKGQVLWPERFGEKEIARLERKMTPRSVAAQLDQLPNVAGGSIFRRAWWKIWLQPKAPQCDAIVISFDPAMKEGQENSRWACGVWGVFRQEPEKPAIPITQAHPKLSFAGLVRETKWMIEQSKPQFNAILLDAWAEHVDYPSAKRKLMATVQEWTLNGAPPDFILIEDKAAGPILIRDMLDAGLRGVLGYNPGRESKVQRANRVSDLWFGGRIWVLGRRMPDGTRTDLILPAQLEEVVKEMALFPAGEHDDHVDQATQAAALMRDQGWLTIPDDPKDDDEDEPEPEQRRAPVYG